MTKQEFATLVVAMQAMYGEDFIGTEQELDVWYALLHDLDYQILSKALQQYMLTNKFKPTVAEMREIYAELVSPVISDWSEGWEKVNRAIGHYGMYQEEAVRKYRCGSGKICRNLPSYSTAEKNGSERRQCTAKLTGNGAESLG